jgi:hypothetical protein
MAEKRASTKRRRASEWQVLVSKLAESGEEVGQFCRRQGIHLPTLRWWQWHLRGSAGELERRRLVATMPEPRFTELNVLESSGLTGAGAGFELRWPDGLTLVIPRHFDEVALRRLLVVLEVPGR